MAYATPSPNVRRAVRQSVCRAGSSPFAMPSAPCRAPCRTPSWTRYAESTDTTRSSVQFQPSVAAYHSSALGDMLFQTAVGHFIPVWRNLCAPARCGCVPFQLPVTAHRPSPHWHNPFQPLWSTSLHPGLDAFRSIPLWTRAAPVSCGHAPLQLPAVRRAGAYRARCRAPCRRSQWMGMICLYFLR